MKHRRQYPATHNIAKFKYLADIEEALAEETDETVQTTFEELLSAGHGVRVQTREDKLEELNLDPRKVRHYMATERDLSEDFQPNAYETFCDEIGPWEYTLEDGETIGYDPVFDSVEALPNHWEVLADGHDDLNFNNRMWYIKAGHTLTRYYKDCAAKREERFQKMLAYLMAPRTKSELNKAWRLFWYNLLNEKAPYSRRYCGRSGNWHKVYLTKEQVQVIEPMLRRLLNKPSR